MSEADVWLLELATVREPVGSSESLTRYDAGMQVSVIDSPTGPSLAIDTHGGSPTKKADIEKGEDQKDRWRP